ncbi:hypothetical protein [Moorena sp. SIO3A2]|uniref:hypothetical protein n=1 Tax=Moorena sp. SIO3A2 TaxID=2607841 RepID=UPI0013BE2B05|nr:hypothetical protein [Moorena sp. SIO3A2]NER90373.1 hypothetical protein [Moorena sp. SIO3A2]
MITWQELHEQFLEDNVWQKIADNPLVQFGTPTNQLLGSRLLPEERTTLRYFERDEMEFRIIPALDTSRYAPPAIQYDGITFGTIRVSLADQSSASQLTAAKLDELVRALRNEQAGTQADDLLIDFYNNLNQRLVIKSEIARWETLLQARNLREGVNQYQEEVLFAYPAANAWLINNGNSGYLQIGGTDELSGWYNRDYDISGYDPIEQDFYRAKEILEDQGYFMQAIYMDSKAARALERNGAIRAWTNSSFRIDVTGQIGALSRQPTRQEVNQYLLGNDFPPITVYNQAYQTETSFRFYMQPPGTPSWRHYILIVGRVDEQTELYYEEKDETVTLENVLGRHFVGIVAGRTSPGRVIYSEVKERHPMGIYAEAIQVTQSAVYHRNALIVLGLNEPVDPRKITTEDFLEVGIDDVTITEATTNDERNAFAIQLEAARAAIPCIAHKGY